MSEKKNLLNNTVKDLESILIEKPWQNYNDAKTEELASELVSQDKALAILKARVEKLDNEIMLIGNKTNTRINGIRESLDKLVKTVMELNRILATQQDRISELSISVAQYKAYAAGSVSLALLAIVLAGIVLRKKKLQSI